MFIRSSMIIRLAHMNEVTVNTFTSNISRSYCPSKTLSDSILSL